jgi:hypothetical protein
MIKMHILLMTLVWIIDWVVTFTRNGRCTRRQEDGGRRKVAYTMLLKIEANFTD